MVLTAYAHLATQWHRLAASGIPREVLASLPRRQLALFRLPWVWDGSSQATNSLERFEALVSDRCSHPPCPLPPARPRLQQPPAPEPDM